MQSKGLQKWQTEAEEWAEAMNCGVRRTPPAIASLEDGESVHEPRDVAPLEARKGKKVPEGTSSVNILILVL